MGRPQDDDETDAIVDAALDLGAAVARGDHDAAAQIADEIRAKGWDKD